MSFAWRVSNDVDPSEDETVAEGALLRGHRKIDLLTRGRRSVAVDIKRLPRAGTVLYDSSKGQTSS